MPIDTKFMGTWELDSSKTQGLKEAGMAMGFTEEQRQLYATLTYSFTLSQEGDAYKVEVDFKGKIPNVSYVVKEGETIDYKSADGRASKLTLTIENGNPSEKYEITDKNVTWSIKRTVEGDTMNVVTTSGGASMTQVLNRVK